MTTKLIVTRRTGEAVAIGDHVTITLLEIQGNQAKVGIAAPREIHVVRAELQDPNRSERPRPAKGGKRSATPVILYRKRRKPG